MTGTSNMQRAGHGIESYGLIGDGRTTALVSRDGSIDWLCLPNVSSPSVFGGILDPKGGVCRIRPRAAAAVRQRYRGETAILETEFECASGCARVIDFFPIDDAQDTMLPLRELVRIVEGVRGVLTFDVLIDPYPEYGRRRVKPRARGKLGWHYAWRNNLLTVTTKIPLVASGNALSGTLQVHAGERVSCTLAFNEGDIGVYPPLAETDARLAATEAWWMAWSGRCRYHGPFRDAVVRSAVTLKLLAHCLSGAVVAAPTTSLPETPGGTRNWDYRYCWLRDAGLVVRAFVGLGYMEEAKAFLEWMLHATRLTWPRLQVVYDIYGRTDLKERELPHWQGYANSRPVRIGNGAYAQEQLDIYGEVVLAADTYVRAGGTLDPVETRMLRNFGDVVACDWRRADHGLWEVRGERRHYTFSKFMCWLALDKLLSLDESGVVGLGRSRTRLADAHRQIAAALEQDGYNADLQTYAATLGGSGLDASLLLMGALKYRPIETGRIATTESRLWAQLGQGPWLRRYADGFDGVPEREGAFIVLSFWAVQSLAARGEIARARELFAEVLGAVNGVGLLSEEIDPDTGSFLGNFPQAFSHTGLINAALALERTERSAG